MMRPEDFNENRKRLELSIAGIIFVIALTYLIFSLFLPKLGFYPLDLKAKPQGRLLPNCPFCYSYKVKTVNLQVAHSGEG